MQKAEERFVLSKADARKQQWFSSAPGSVGSPSSFAFCAACRLPQTLRCRLYPEAG